MSSSVLILLISMVAGVAVLSLAMGIRSMLVGDTDLSDRLNRFGTIAPTVDNAVPTKRKLRQMLSLNLRSSGLIKDVNRSLQNQGYGERIRRALARADVKVTVAEFLVFNMIATLIGVLIGAFIFGTPIHLAVFTLAGLLGPHWWLRIKQSRRRKKFAGQLADTISMMANSLRAGYSVLSAMELVSKESGPPISDEFHRVTAEVGLGLPPEDALANLVRRVNSTDLELMVIAMNVQREVGGNLAEIMDVIANTIRERVKLQGEIKTLTAQQTMAMYIIIGLPLFLAFVIYTLDHHYIATFWENKTCGLPMMGASLFLMTVGYFVMKKIVAIEV